IALLPYVEQDNLRKLYVIDDPPPPAVSLWNNNKIDPTTSQPGPGAMSARTFKQLNCPSQPSVNYIDDVTDLPNVWAITGYRGVAGVVAWRDNDETVDGTFWRNSKLGIADIIDGTSNTIIFSEFNNSDPNFEKFLCPSPPNNCDDTLRGWGWWVYGGAG